jgi:hypothetical protein
MDAMMQLFKIKKAIVYTFLPLILGCLSNSVSAQLEDFDCFLIFEYCEEDLVDYLTENVGMDNCFQWESGCGISHDIYRMGRVAIGTDQVPSGVDLAVKGGIVTNLIKVQLCDSEGEEWCDYVFEDDYELWDLCEVEEFILDNGHLPNTPSAAQVEEEGGFELKAVKLNQQEKIEEIFLYLIQIKDQIKDLGKEIELLEKENLALKNL